MQLQVKEIKALCAVTGARLTLGYQRCGLWRATIVRDKVIAMQRMGDRLGAARAAWEAYAKYIDSR